MKSHKEYLLNYLKIPFTYGRGISCTAIFLCSLSAVLPLAEMLLLSACIDRITIFFKGDESLLGVYGLVGVWGLLIGGSWLLGQADVFLTDQLTYRLRQNFHTLLVKKCARMSCPFIESEERQNQIRRVMKNPEGEIVEGFYLLLRLSAAALRVLGVVLILSGKVWWCGASVLLLSVPVVYLSKKAARLSIRLTKIPRCISGNTNI